MLKKKACFDLTFPSGEMKFPLVILVGLFNTSKTSSLGSL